LLRLGSEPRIFWFCSFSHLPLGHSGSPGSIFPTKAVYDWKVLIIM
jgi:hypothetical protein